MFHLWWNCWQHWQDSGNLLSFLKVSPDIPQSFFRFFSQFTWTLHSLKLRIWRGTLLNWHKRTKPGLLSLLWNKNPAIEVPASSITSKTLWGNSQNSYVPQEDWFWSILALPPKWFKFFSVLLGSVFDPPQQDLLHYHFYSCKVLGDCWSSFVTPKSFHKITH